VFLNLIDAVKRNKEFIAVAVFDVDVVVFGFAEFFRDDLQKATDAVIVMDDVIAGFEIVDGDEPFRVLNDGAIAAAFEWRLFADNRVLGDDREIAGSEGEVEIAVVGEQMNPTGFEGRQRIDEPVTDFARVEEFLKMAERDQRLHCQDDGVRPDVRRQIAKQILEIAFVARRRFAGEAEFAVER